MHGPPPRLARAARLSPILGLTLCLSTTVSGTTSHPDAPAHPSRATAEAVRRVQETVDEVRTKLALPDEVTAVIVDTHPLVVAVEPMRGGAGTFRVSVEASFLDELTDHELEAVVAHELGHVWIFTHHPFLQTEQLANQIAMRVVSRQALDAVYEKVWARGGHKGDLPR